MNALRILYLLAVSLVSVAAKVGGCHGFFQVIAHLFDLQYHHHYRLITTPHPTYPKHTLSVGWRRSSSTSRTNSS